LKSRLFWNPPCGTVEVAECGNNREKIFSLEAVGRHSQIGGEFFDVEILSGLKAGQRGDRGHLRPKVKVCNLCLEEADRSVGD